MLLFVRVKNLWPCSMLLFPSVFSPANPVNSATYIKVCHFLLTRCVCVCVYPWFARLQRGVLPAARISGDKTLLDAFFHGGIDAQLLFFGQRLPFGVGRPSIACRWICLENSFGKRRRERARERLCGYLRPKLCVARARVFPLAACSFVLSHRVTDDVDDNNNGPTTLSRAAALVIARGGGADSPRSSFNYNNSSHSRYQTTCNPFCPTLLLTHSTCWKPLCCFTDSER